METNISLSQAINKLNAYYVKQQDKNDKIERNDLYVIADNSLKIKNHYFNECLKIIFKGKIKK